MFWHRKSWLCLEIISYLNHFPNYALYVLNISCSPCLMLSCYNLAFNYSFMLLYFKLFVPFLSCLVLFNYSWYLPFHCMLELDESYGVRITFSWLCTKFWFFQLIWIKSSQLKNIKTNIHLSIGAPIQPLLIATMLST